MKHLIYIILSILCLTACQNENVELRTGKGEMILSLSRGPLPQVTTRAVDADLALEIIAPDNTMKSYAPGTVPAKIILDANVEYTIRAYTENQQTWPSANGGRGEACYWGETKVSVGEDATVYVDYAVPMKNYAVTLTLPELFNDLFKSYTFSLKCGSREVTLREGEKAYFDVNETGFSYKLTATNTDEKTSSHNYVEYPDVEEGKLYNIKYVYGTDLNTGGVDIEITDNTEHEDVDINV